MLKALVKRTGFLVGLVFVVIATGFIFIGCLFGVIANYLTGIDPVEEI